MPRKPTDWRKRFDTAKPPRTVVPHTDFAGIRAGAVVYIASPGVIANDISRVPAGETRSIERMRHELARKNGATATCPVTTAIYLKVVAEAALQDLARGLPVESVTPFWRVIDPGGKIANRLTCDSEFIRHARELERAGEGTKHGFQT